ncbi:mannitol-1-phosphate 5-dehydrogenase [Halalkalibacter nanhaiisediminis]|uniref:Mannitol-1-phosphate 5-dehydrogenase n=1 Tax=Halalkalibacter nanhaiisediminis TaxID=688079 RepID=A0A562QD40_9BACI|nr:mannitol-1-phosphate 5-dehydrogenase [Halalkalibacter nanhaiisediminis]TWI54677.1 mannitol-1-phosphate 5-dehydrogenase [Halalkalibacter nanhaiisediminis]
MLAVHFGAGNIGRGFIGLLLNQSGYHTTFVDVNGEIVDLINEKQEYRVVLADQTKEEVSVTNVSAINSMNDPEKVIDAIVKADIVTTAVGPNILPIIAKSIVAGLRKRVAENKKDLSIIACENLIGGSTLLKNSVYEGLSGEEKGEFDQYFSFPDAAVDRIVPNQTNDDKLMVTVEPYYEWVVDQSMIKGEVPPVKGVTFVDDLTPFIERKLFTVNTGHAIAAYLGYHAGMKTIDEALASNEIKADVEHTLNETGQLLVKKYDFKMDEHKSYINKIINRFLNPYITDEVTRVGRAPLRKLGANDRLVSPAKQFSEVVGGKPTYLAKGIAAALKYDVKEDPEAVEIQELIHENGLKQAIYEITALQEGSKLVDLIIEQYELLGNRK